MSISHIDRIVAALADLVEDRDLTPTQRKKAAAIARELLTMRPAKKRRTETLGKILENLGVKPAKSDSAAKALQERQ